MLTFFHQSVVTIQCRALKLIHKIKHNPSFKRTIYDYRKLYVEKLSNELSNVKWMDIVSLHSIEEAAQLFSDTLHNMAKKLKQMYACESN